MRCGRLALFFVCVTAEELLTTELSYSFSYDADSAFGYFSLLFKNEHPVTTLKLSRVLTRDAADSIDATPELLVAPNENASFTGLHGHRLWAKFFFKDAAQSDVVCVQTSF